MFSKIALSLFLGLNILAIGTGLTLTYMSTIGWHKPSLRNEQLIPEMEHKTRIITADPIIFTMEPFTVNLNGLPERVVNVEINLQLLDEDGYEEIISLGPQARDSVVRLLNAKSFTDLESIQGKLFLKDQIAHTLNGLLKNGVIEGVFFSKFNVAVR
jgi:flagellar protein FliL